MREEFNTDILGSYSCTAVQRLSSNHQFIILEFNLKCDNFPLLYIEHRCCMNVVKLNSVITAPKAFRATPTSPLEHKFDQSVSRRVLCYLYVDSVRE